MRLTHIVLAILALALSMAVFSCVPTCRREFTTSKNLAIHTAKCNAHRDHEARQQSKLAAKLAAKKHRLGQRKECRSPGEAVDKNPMLDVASTVKSSLPVEVSVSCSQHRKQLTQIMPTATLLQCRLRVGYNRSSSYSFRSPVG